MAFDKTDSYETISNGLFSGTLYEAGITDAERYTRIISHGLLETAPAPPVFDASQSGGLNNVGTSIRL